jgi:hypothetical protein
MRNDYSSLAEKYILPSWWSNGAYTDWIWNENYRNTAAGAEDLCGYHLGDLAIGAFL